MSEVYMMVTVIDRKDTERFLEFYAGRQADVQIVALGKGTAGSEILDYLGLEDAEKAVALSVVTGDVWQTIKKGLRQKFRIDVPGTGIAFTVPVSSIGGKRELLFLLDGQDFEKGEETVLKDTAHELIVVIANQGYNEMVMDAARRAGAGGGTVLHARGTGMKRAEKFLGVSLVSEKELVLIVAKTEKKNAIMQAVMQGAGMDTKAKAIVFSLPVTDTAGLRLIEEDDESGEQV